MNCPFCEVEHAVTVPQINLNGTHPQDLREEVLRALEAVRDAEKALLDACPNGRDYQGLSGAAAIALSQHSHRLDAIERIKRELDEILGHIQAVIDHREAQRTPA